MIIDKPPLFERILDAFQHINGHLGSLLGQSLERYVIHEDIADEHTFVTRGGELITFLDVRGSNMIVGEEELGSIQTTLVQSIDALFSGKSHSIDWWYEYDEDSSLESLETNANVLKEACREKGINLDRIIEEQCNINAGLSKPESNILIIWTNLTNLSKYDRDILIKERQKMAAAMPFANEAQKGLMYSKKTYVEHQAMVEQVLEMFSISSIQLNKVHVDDAIRLMRKSLYNSSSDEFQPQHALSYRQFTVPEYYGRDASDVYWPKLSGQIIQGDMHEKGRYIEVDGRIYAPVTLDELPHEEQTFNALVTKLRDLKVPFRVKFSISPDVAGIWGLRIQLARAIRWTASHTSNQLVDSHKTYIDMQTEGIPQVKFQATFCTWADIGQDELLAQRASQLMKTLQSWTAKPADSEGDITASFLSSAPGVTKGNMGTPACAPLTDVITLMPHSRPPHVWSDGSVISRTSHGKIFYEQVQPPEIVPHIKQYVGPPGTGKSNRMAADHLGLIMKPGTSELPFICQIDIGYTSRGLIRALRNNFTNSIDIERAQYHQINNTEAYAYNVLQTFTGLRYPTSYQLDFAVGFVHSLVVKPGQEDHPSMETLIKLAIQHAYKVAAERGYNTFNAYYEGANPKIDEIVAKHGVRAINSKTMLYDIVDFLMARGAKQDAAYVHRYAVPTLESVVRAIKDNAVAARYQDAEYLGENITEAVSRLLSDALISYPPFAKPTQFNVDDARILSIDLQNVGESSSASADRQLALFYDWVNKIFSDKLFWNEEMIAEMKFPDENCQYPFDYRQYYENHARVISRVARRLSGDEVHRLKIPGYEAPFRNLDRVAREGRKRGVEIVVASQKAKDFPDGIQEFATAIYLMGWNTDKELKETSELFDLSETEHYVFKHKMQKPSSKGSHSLVRFTLKKYPLMVHLINSQGPYFLWNLTTNYDDNIIRERLLREIGDAKDVDNVLVANFPSGSAENSIQARKDHKKLEMKKLIRSTNHGGQTSDLDDEELEKIKSSVVDEICEELLEFHRDKIVSARLRAPVELEPA